MSGKRSDKSTKVEPGSISEDQDEDEEFDITGNTALGTTARSSDDRDREKSATSGEA